MTDDVFNRRESNVRTYSRSFPAVFASARGSWMTDRDGHRYLDFLAGAGALNYGHNPEEVKKAVLGHLEQDGLVHGLDLATTAKAEFLETFERVVLQPRGLDHRVQFCGPTGTNAVEAALKLARLVTGRSNVLSFSGGFHGVSAGSLAVTGSAHHRRGLHASLPRTTVIPYPDSPAGPFDSLDLLRRIVEDTGSGVEKPAAVVVETVQGEGGVYLAPTGFLVGLRELCDRHGILLVVDDVQAGCGRTGTFFSFERAGIRPDLVTLAKSIGGYGLPMAVLLLAPEHDVWEPGQHNGTFRGNQLAFVAAAAALRTYWEEGRIQERVEEHRGFVAGFLAERVTAAFGLPVRGTGLIWGIDFGRNARRARRVSEICFREGLLAETCGRDGEVLKLLPPLTISRADLAHGLETVARAVAESDHEEGGAGARS